jgi:hypothetical protein
LKRSSKVSGIICLVSLFLLAPAAMGIMVKGAEPLGQFSEPVAMLMLGTGLVGMAGFWRKNRSRNL